MQPGVLQLQLMPQELFAHRSSQKQQMATHILPRVENTAKITGTKVKRQWH